MREGGGVIWAVLGDLAAGEGGISLGCWCGWAMMTCICSSTIWTTSATTLSHSSSLGASASPSIRLSLLGSICLLERSPCVVTSLSVVAQAQLGYRSVNNASRDIRLCFLAMAEVIDRYRCDGRRQVGLEIIFQPEL